VRYGTHNQSAAAVGVRPRAWRSAVICAGIGRG
jgi:hypothetical protein